MKSLVNKALLLALVAAAPMVAGENSQQALWTQQVAHAKQMVQTASEDCWNGWDAGVQDLIDQERTAESYQVMFKELYARGYDAALPKVPSFAQRMQWHFYNGLEFAKNNKLKAAGYSVAALGATAATIAAMKHFVVPGVQRAYAKVKSLFASKAAQKNSLVAKKTRTKKPSVKFIAPAKSVQQVKAKTKGARVTIKRSQTKVKRGRAVRAA